MNLYRVTVRVQGGTWEYYVASEQDGVAIRLAMEEVEKVVKPDALEQATTMVVNMGKVLS